MSKKTATFIVTQYKNRPAKVSYYTVKRGEVKFTATEKAPTKERVRLRARAS